MLQSTKRSKEKQQLENKTPQATPNHISNSNKPSTTYQIVLLAGRRVLKWQLHVAHLIGFDD
jgi:hypothetical protein